MVLFRNFPVVSIGKYEQERNMEGLLLVFGILPDGTEQSPLSIRVILWKAYAITQSRL